jgi:hypothetical protein
MISEIFSLSIGALSGFGLYVSIMIAVENHLSKEERRLLLKK